MSQLGVEFTAEHVLPLLAPLLVSQQLNTMHFSKYISFVKDVLRRIEEKRGVAVNAVGTSVSKQPPSSRDGSTTEAQNNTGGPISASRKSRSWNEDWWAPPKPKSAESPSRPHSDKPNETATAALYVSPAAPSVEWPPPSPPALNDTLDEWRTSPENLPSFNSMNNPINGPKPSQSGSMWLFDNDLYPMAGTVSQDVNKQNSGRGNLGLVFGGGKAENRSSLRLAPPPTSSVARGGKGRGPGAKHGNKRNTEGPPLLDLL